MPANELGIAFRDVGGAFPADRKDSPFLKDVQALIALRKREPALRRGDFAEVLARDAVYAFLRSFGEDRILIVLNGSDRPQRVRHADRRSAVEGLPAGGPDRRRDHQAGRRRGGNRRGGIRQRGSCG